MNKYSVTKIGFASISIATALNAFAQTTLDNDTAVVGLEGAAASEQRFTLNVPANPARVVFSMSGGSGDADLYVKFGQAAELNTFDCRPFIAGNNETCSIQDPQEGIYHVTVRGYSAFSDVQLKGQYLTEDEVVITSLEKNVAISGVSGAQASETLYKITLPENAINLSVRVNGGSGDVDLYLNPTTAPTLNTYECRPWIGGNNEICNIQSPTAGEYFVMLRGYAAYSGVTLLADYDVDGSDPVDPVDPVDPIDPVDPVDPIEPTDPPSGECDLSEQDQALLDAHNAARATGRNCGTEFFPAAPALSWNCNLEQAALNHSTDMATVNFFSHTGSDGSNAGNRITATGYNWSTWGENIAAGQQSVESVMNGWLTSVPHCKGIMSATRTEMGAARVNTNSANFSSYWTAVFGRPQ